MKDNNTPKWVYIIRRAVVLLALAVLAIAVGKTEKMLLTEHPIKCDPPQVVAKKDDTMWSIAKKACPKEHYRIGEIVSKMVRLNGHVNLEVGDIVLLP